MRNIIAKYQLGKYIWDNIEIMEDFENNILSKRSAYHNEFLGRLHQIVVHNCKKNKVRVLSKLITENYERN